MSVSSARGSEKSEAGQGDGEFAVLSMGLCEGLAEQVVFE